MPEGLKWEAWTSSRGFPLRRWSRSVASRCWKTCNGSSLHPCMGVHMRPRWGEPRGDRPFLVVWRPEEAVPLILSVLSPYCSCLVGTLLAANASGWLLGRKAVLQNPSTATASGGTGTRWGQSSRVMGQKLHSALLGTTNAGFSSAIRRIRLPSCSMNSGLMA